MNDWMLEPIVAEMCDYRLYFIAISEVYFMKICFVGSSGGHLTHLYMLKTFWQDKERFWCTFDKEDARSLLVGEKFYPVYMDYWKPVMNMNLSRKYLWLKVYSDKCEEKAGIAGKDRRGGELRNGKAARIFGRSKKSWCLWWL